MSSFSMQEGSKAKRDVSSRPIHIRLTRHNRNSVAALLAVLEKELGNHLPEVRIAIHPDEVLEGSLVIYSFMTAHAEQVSREVRALQQRCGDTLFLAGGSHPSGDPEGVLGMGFGWVAVGEAGESFARFVHRIATGFTPPSGILPSSPPYDMDRYDPWPRSGRLFTQIEITRGCPRACTFCQTPTLFGRKVRHRSLSSIERILRSSVETGHRFTRFIAPDAFAYGSPDGRTLRPRAVESLLRITRECGLKKVFFGTFPSEVRPESATPQMLDLVRQLCDNVNLSVGLQSGSDDTLRRIRRGHTVRQGVDAVASMAKAGFVPRVDFIFGLPGESDSDRRATREVIDHVTSAYGARVHAHVFVPLPGTALGGACPSSIDGATKELVEALRGQGKVTGHATDLDRLPRHLLRMVEGSGQQMIGKVFPLVGLGAVDAPERVCDSSDRTTGRKQA